MNGTTPNAQFSIERVLPHVKQQTGSIKFKAALFYTCNRDTDREPKAEKLAT